MRTAILISLLLVASSQDLPQGPFTLDIQAPNSACVAGRPGPLKVTVLDRLGKLAPLNGLTVIVRTTDPKSPLNGLQVPLTNGIGTMADAVQFFTPGEHQINAATQDGSAKGVKKGLCVSELPKNTTLSFERPACVQASSAVNLKGKASCGDVEIRIKLSRGASIHPRRVFTDANGAFEFTLLTPLLKCEGPVLLGDTPLELDGFIDSNNNGLADDTLGEPCVDCPPAPITHPCPLDLIIAAHFELTLLASGFCASPPPPGPIDAAVVSSIPLAPRNEEARLRDALRALQEKVIDFINQGAWNGRFSMVVDRLRQIEKFVRTIPCANAVAERLDCAAQILSRNPDVSELRVNIQNDKKKPSVPAGFQGTLTAQLIGKSGTILDPSLFHPCTVPVLTEASTVGLGSATLPGFPSLDFHYQCLGVGSVLLSLHAAFVPSQVQDINGGIVAASLPVPGDGLVVLRPFPMTTLMTILQVNRVDLRIFRPKASGGAEIDDAKSVTPGGFTVANKNDSNSDETIDSTQEDYKGERDLIKLRIIRGANDVGPLTVTLDLPAVTPAAHQDLQNELDAAHRARMVTSMLLYEDEGLKKRVGDGKLPEDVTIPKGKNSIEVYIEGLNESMRVRDMLIVARVNRAGAPVEEDMVALTFIWATIDGPETKHDNIGAGPILWPDVTNPPSGGFAPFGNFGLRNRIAPTGTGIYANVIGMRATVYPPGIDLEPDVKFDVTRDKEGRTWLIESDGDVALMQTFDFPKTDDQANDDGDTAPIIDQSIDPNAARHFFSIDAPRVLGDPKAQEFLVIRSLNFREWMRVRVDGKYPRGNTSEGSRCSDKFNWHSRHLYRDQNPGGGRQWVRINMAGAATALVETPPNFQGLGNNIHIGHTPMPAKISTTVPGTFPLKVDKFQK